MKSSMGPVMYSAYLLLSLVYQEYKGPFTQKHFLTNLSQALC